MSYSLQRYGLYLVHQGALSMGFSRQEYWSVLPFPPPGDLPDPGIKPKSPVSLALAGRFFTTRTTQLFTMAEHWRIDAFELWCWRRLLRVPWTAKIPNQSILKEINPEYSLLRTDADTEAPILWPPDAKNWFTGKDPDAGKDWRQEGKGMTEDEMVGWHQWTQWTWVWASSRSWWWTGRPGMLQSMGLQRVRHDWATELNWTSD